MMHCSGVVYRQLTPLALSFFKFCFSLSVCLFNGCTTLVHYMEFDILNINIIEYYVMFLSILSSSPGVDSGTVGQCLCLFYTSLFLSL